MPLPTTTAADLDRHLREIGLPAHPNIVVHSRLISFGSIEGGAAAVYECLRRAIGPAGTIAVPTYTLELGESRTYDPRLSESSGVGALAEYVRRHPLAVRSSCPLHSHAAVGPASSFLSKVPGTHSLGPSSDFDALLAHGFSLLLLGCGFDEGGTFLHHLEAVVGVPYREWIDLRRARVIDGAEEVIRVRYYGRTSAQWTEDFDKARVRMEEAGLLQTANCAFGRSYLVALRTVNDFVTSMLRADPFALVRPVPGAVHA